MPPVARQPVLPQLSAAIAAPYPVEAAVLDLEQVGLVGLMIRKASYLELKPLLLWLF